MEKIIEGDIIVFKSGAKKEYTSKDKWLIDNFYDKNLNCITNDKFTIIEILRPHYETIYTKKVKVKKL